MVICGPIFHGAPTPGWPRAHPLLWQVDGCRYDGFRTETRVKRTIEPTAGPKLVNAPLVLAAELAKVDPEPKVVSSGHLQLVLGRGAVAQRGGAAAALIRAACSRR